jgi:1,4-dihydroxy-2-naphthoate octaprenyltransferase
MCRTLALKPALFTASIIWSTLTCLGSNSTTACANWKLTSALLIPWSLSKARLTFRGQENGHVIPSMRSVACFSVSATVIPANVTAETLRRIARKLRRSIATPCSSYSRMTWL